MKTIGEIGEKRLITEFIRPFFNETNAPEGVGDDCAMVATDGATVLLSTDRVPADLISFRLGILDFEGLGRYLAVLNISDIAACGGTPKALLLNFGLPGTFAYENLVSLCRGVRRMSEKFNCPVLGGDLSAATEISISATVMGIAGSQGALTRRGARPGDSVFISRSIGRTPAAFAYYFQCPASVLTPEEVVEINHQFTGLEPMIELGQKLAACGVCSSCMDNTDGLGQTFIELAENSGVAFHIEKTKLRVDDLVTKVAEGAHLDATTLGLSAGADFSLVGTLRGRWPQEGVREKLGLAIDVVGHVTAGEGAWLDDVSSQERMRPEGWNYFKQNGCFGEKVPR